MNQTTPEQGTSAVLPAAVTAGEGALSPDGIMQIGLGFWASKTLLSAVELGIFTRLAQGSLTLEQLRAASGLHERAARDFFDALVALHLLDRDEAGRYSNTAQSALFLDRAKPSYVGGMLEMANDRLYPFWGNLTQALRTGRPQNESRHGQDLFTVLYEDPDRLRLFLGGMTGLSIPIARAIAASFPWNTAQSFVDVGCAQGGCVVEIAAAHPHLRGIGFDLAPVRPVFEEYVQRAGLAERLQFQGGDFFADPLPQADVVVMGHILHDWDLPRKRELLRKAHAALPDGGSLLVYEALIDDARRENVRGLLTSLNMLIETSGGFDFSGADCSGWMREAGFRETRVVPLTGTHAMVVATK